MMNTTTERPGIDLRKGLVTSLGPLPVVLVVGVLLGYLAYSRLATRSKYSKLPLPPGPPQLPLVGNLFNNPLPYRWLTHCQWKQSYGPVVYVNEAGSPAIVLTTVEAAHELLSKRASNYSGRAFGTMASDLVSNGWNMIFRQYDVNFRLHQRVHVQGLNPRSANLYHPVQELETLQLLHDMLAEQKTTQQSLSNKEGLPKDYIQAIDPHRDFLRASSSSLSVIDFGHRLLKGNPEHEALLEFFSHIPTVAGMIMAGWIDVLPWLKHIPYVLSPWKRFAKPLFEAENAHHVSRFRTGLKSPGYNLSKQVWRSVERLDAGMSEEEAAWVAGALTLANSDTTPSVLRWFVVIMVVYPRVMHKAQEQLDEIVGRDRLPTYEDRPRLPYIDAVIDEVLRWRSVIPGGVDHASVEEDEYMGYRIPAGSRICVSHYVMGRDKDVYGEDCEDFRPERWLERPDMPSLAFGFGRRVCPGRHVGREALWIVFARLLWAFEMEAPTDPVTGKKKVMDVTASPPGGLAFGPLPYEAVFRPRGKWVEEVIQRGFDNAEHDVTRLMEQIESAKRT